MAHLVKQKAGVPVIFPTIKIVETDNWTPTDSAISKLSRFDWIVFTSARGVKYFTQRLSEVSNLEELHSLSVACVGSKTAESLESLGVSITLVPENYTAESLLAGFQSLEKLANKVLLVKGDKSKETISLGLKELDITYEKITVYRNISPDPSSVKELLKPFFTQEQNVLTFTSPSTFHNFCSIIESSELSLSSLLETNFVAAIGPVTASSIEETGTAVDIVPDQSTIEDMITSIATYLRTYEPDTHDEDIAI